MKKLILTTLLTLTANVAIATNKLPQPKPTTTKLSLPTFSAINATGRINVMIIGTHSKNPSDTVVENKNPQWVTAKVRNHVLYLHALSAASPSLKAPTVKVRMYRLNKLEAYGRASITAKNVQSDGLYLHADTTRNITLSGKLAVNQIRNYGPSHINLRWVKGKEINIQSYAGRITLAGRADQVRVKLRNHAILDAQYLRTKHVVVQTKDFSVAKVLPIDSLRAFATDHSNVYFYKTPQHISRYTSRSGNILQMGRRK